MAGPDPATSARSTASTRPNPSAASSSRSLSSVATIEPVTGLGLSDLMASTGPFPVINAALNV